jgi:hypothetical protein
VVEALVAGHVELLKHGHDVAALARGIALHGLPAGAGKGRGCRGRRG